MLLLVDNFSSYFNDIIECLTRINSQYTIKKYNDLDGYDINNYDGIILSGRTNNIKSMNVTNVRLINSAYNDDKPLFGICYGAEITALAFNGSLQRLNDRIIGDNNISVNKENPLTSKKMLDVFESHGYYISRLPESFTGIADSSTCKYEIIVHKRKQIFGTQFHPEVSKDGLEILSNFVQLTRH
ncbi:MAG: gamma-glutamyl-gamma-aminobutyrate hydrolase family protein [Nitrososphaerales archaeon]